MAKTITIDLNQDITEQIKKLDDIKKWIQEKTDLLIEKLKDIGLEYAQVNFGHAIYNTNYEGVGATDISVTAEKTPKGYSIIANGEAVCFIEFGAGITYGTEYPLPRPEGIVGIGEYGDGKGRQSAWKYESAEGVKWTSGTPTQAPLYWASKEIENNIQKIASEVFR